jgi:membrane protease YdiL (CAAX protease family)
MGFTAIVAVVYLVIQYVAMFVYGLHLKAVNPGMTEESIFKSITSSGFIVAVVNCVSVLPCVGLVLFFIWLRKGITWKEYLAVNRPRARQFFMWLGITAVYAIAADALTVLLGRPVVPEFWINAYDTAQVLPLFFLALLVAAPLNEEIFFRGFMLAGIRNSVLGAVGAVLIPALVWTSIHLQYDYYELSTIFAAGILLGIARLRTNSIFTSMAIHALINLWACVQLLWVSWSWSAL